MKIELIPVIEIGYNNVGVTPPNQYPYWKHPEVWDKYHAGHETRIHFLLRYSSAGAVKKI